MKQALYREIIEVGGDPNSTIWQWLVLRGPHGPDFTWSQTKREPPGYVGVEHLENIIAAQTEGDPLRPSAVRCVARMALRSNSSNILRRGIQVLAIVGDASDKQDIAQYVSHSDAAVAADARAANFYLRAKLKGV